jgi:ribonuclease HI
MNDNDPWLHWVTLYTDAGFHPVARGTYGCRTRHSFPPFRTEICGPVPDPCKDSNVAEMHAIVVGVEHVLQTWTRVDGIGVNTDSQTAQGCLKYGATPHRRSDFRALQERLKAALNAKAADQGSEVRIRIKWVRSHQSPNEGGVRGWLNNRVDALARKARR